MSTSMMSSMSRFRVILVVPTLLLVAPAVSAAPVYYGGHVGKVPTQSRYAIFYDTLPGSSDCFVTYERFDHEALGQEAARIKPRYYAAPADPHDPNNNNDHADPEDVSGLAVEDSWRALFSKPSSRVFENVGPSCEALPHFTGLARASCAAGGAARVHMDGSLGGGSFSACVARETHNRFIAEKEEQGAEILAKLKRGEKLLDAEKGWESRLGRPAREDELLLMYAQSGFKKRVVGDGEEFKEGGFSMYGAGFGDKTNEESAEPDSNQLAAFRDGVGRTGSGEAKRRYTLVATREKGFRYHSTEKPFVEADFVGQLFAEVNEPDRKRAANSESSGCLESSLIVKTAGASTGDASSTYFEKLFLDDSEIAAWLPDNPDLSVDPGARQFFPTENHRQNISLLPNRPESVGFDGKLMLGATRDQKNRENGWYIGGHPENRVLPGPNEDKSFTFTWVRDADCRETRGWYTAASFRCLLESKAGNNGSLQACVAAKRAVYFLKRVTVARYFSGGNAGGAQPSSAEEDRFRIAGFRESTDEEIAAVRKMMAEMSFWTQMMILIFICGGAFILVVTAFIVIWCCWCRKRKGDEEKVIPDYCAEEADCGHDPAKDAKDALSSADLEKGEGGGSTINIRAGAGEPGTTAAAGNARASAEKPETPEQRLLREKRDEERERREAEHLRLIEREKQRLGVRNFALERLAAGGDTKKAIAAVNAAAERRRSRKRGEEDHPRGEEDPEGYNILPQGEEITAVVMENLEENINCSSPDEEGLYDDMTEAGAEKPVGGADPGAGPAGAASASSAAKNPHLTAAALASLDTYGEDDETLIPIAIHGGEDGGSTRSMDEFADLFSTDNEGEKAALEELSDGGFELADLGLVGSQAKISRKKNLAGERRRKSKEKSAQKKPGDSGAVVVEIDGELPEAPGALGDEQGAAGFKAPRAKSAEKKGAKKDAKTGKKDGKNSKVREKKGPATDAATKTGDKKEDAKDAAGQKEAAGQKKKP